MRREWFVSIGAMVMAFLASQHHNLMLLLMTLGLGGTEMSFMTAAPLVRRAMLLLSLAMVAVIGFQMRDAKRPRTVRITGLISIVVTVGLAGWSILRFGL
jgi:hypothetical protein